MHPTEPPAANGPRSLPSGEVASAWTKTFMVLDVVPSEPVSFPAEASDESVVERGVPAFIGEVRPLLFLALQVMNDFSPAGSDEDNLLVIVQAPVIPGLLAAFYIAWVAISSAAPFELRFIALTRSSLFTRQSCVVSVCNWTTESTSPNRICLNVV